MSNKDETPKDETLTEDEELAKLLGEVEPTDVDLNKIVGPADKIDVAPKKPKKKKKPQPEPKLAEMPKAKKPEKKEVAAPVEEPELVPAVIEQKEPPPSELIQEEEEGKEQAGVRQLVMKFAGVVDEVLENNTENRKQLQEAIEYLDTQIKEARESGAKLSPVFVEQWAKLMIAKAEINTNTSKVLDSVAKLVAAGKGNELVIVNNNMEKTGSLDLESLLSQPAYEDETAEKSSDTL